MGISRKLEEIIYGWGLYGGIPTYIQNNSSHDGVNGLSTAVPHAATDALAQMSSDRDARYVQPSEEMQPVTTPHGCLSESVSNAPGITDVHGIYTRG